MKDGELKKQIVSRNIREWIACAFVSVIFFYFTLNSKDTFLKVASFELFLTGIFISWYLYRSSYLPLRRANSEVDILINEIALLSTARYWYVLPFFIGIFSIEAYSFVSSFNGHSFDVPSLISLLFLFLFCGGLIYLNEFYAVKKLEERLQEIEA